MADEQHPTTTGPDTPGAPGPRRWLRWGSVLVDIEPPQAPNPWTSPGWRAPGAAPTGPAPVAEPRSSRRNLVLFAMAAVASMVLGALLVAFFARDDERPVLAVATTTTRPAPTTTPITTVVTPTTGPAATTVPSRPASTPAPATTGAPAPGGPITVPEGIPAVPPSTTAPSSTTVPPSTSVPAGPVAFLGVTVEDSVEGPRIVEVLPGTGAEGAGLLPLDVVTTIDSTPVATMDELGAAIQSHEPGDSITVTVLRNGATVTVRATLGQR